MKSLAILVLAVLLLGNLTSVAIAKNNNSNLADPADYTNEIYEVRTKDGFSVTLTRYVGSKRPSIMLIHGMGCNHKIFDFDENHSLARFLAKEGWDVWLLDLRTHDGDGDYILGKLRGVDSDIEFICRYWDFDKTYLKIDVVTAIDFIKQKTNYSKIFLGGHSYGGYLAYAYAELIGEENLAGIITTGASAMAAPLSYAKPLSELYKAGLKIGERVFVRPFSCQIRRYLKIIPRNYENYKPLPSMFYDYTTKREIQLACMFMGDNEPMGARVDMYFGKDPRFYDGHWVDPQTLYDYTENLHKITVPFLAIAGDNDTQDPKDDIFKTFENVSSENKEFLHFAKHSHMDLLLGENASSLIFPEVSNWLNLRISS